MGAVDRKSRSSDKQQQPQNPDSSLTKANPETQKADASEKMSSEKSLEKFRKLVETTKVSALKKFIINKPANTQNKEPSPAPDSLVRGKLWDDTLASLELKGMRSSQMCREMGVKHVRIQLPTPVIKDVVVKKKTKEKTKDRMTYGVLRSINANIEVKPMEPPTDFSGPKCNDSGQIVAHTLLGDVNSFLKEAEKRGEFQAIRDQQRSSKTTVAPVKQSPRTPWNPLLNEDNALRNWHREMGLRREEQRRLASMINRQECQLLMCKSDQFVKKTELRGVIQNELHKNEPDVCFWKLEDSLGAKQIQCTLTKTEKGEGNTQPIGGDTDIVARQKGRFCDPESNVWLHSSYVQQRDEELGGVIHVANSVLFDELEVAGDAIYPPKQSNSFHNITNPCKQNNSSSYLSKEGNISNPLSNMSTPLKGYKGGYHCIPDPKGDNCSSESKYSPFVMQKLSSEQISPYSCGEDSIRSIFVPGPALLIDGRVLRWQNDGASPNNMEKSVIKETFIVIEGRVEEVAESHVEITNCGSTVVQYNWKKLPDVRPLPVARPERRPFYFMADEGIILPRQTIYIPLLFRSKIQGYFSQSWLLTTVPEIERGAAIKFTFKGIAFGIDDYSQDCKEIEDSLLKKQGRSICEYEAKRLLELAILKASLQYGQPKEDGVVPGLEELFEMENPGMYFHANVLHRLEEIHKTLISDMLNYRKEDEILIYNNNNILSVAQLRLAVLQITDSAEDPDSNDSSFIIQQQLLSQLNLEVDQLSCRPLTPIHSVSQQKYCVTYTLVLYGLDSVVTYAHYLTNKMGLVIQEEEEEEEDVEQKAGKKKKNGAKTKQKTDKQSKSKSESAKKPTCNPSGPLNASSPENNKQEVIVHSTAYKYRMANTSSSTLASYDEKVYLSMYHMLESTLETICELFDR